MKMNLRWIGLVTLLLVTSCTTAPRRKQPPTSTTRIPPVTTLPKQQPQQPSGTFIDSNAFLNSPEYQRLNQLYLKEDYAQVIKGATDLEPKLNYNLNQAYVRNLKGLAHLGLKQPLPAITQFQRALDSLHPATLRPHLKYNLATAYYESQQYEDAAQLLYEFDYEAAPEDLRLKALQTLARTEIQLAHFPESVRATLKASIIAGPEQSERPQFLELLDRGLFPIQKSEDLQRALEGLENAPLANRVRQKLTSPERLAEAAKSSEGFTKSVGVLLPLSGKFSAFGSRALKSISQAFRIYDPNGDNYTLHIEDTGDTAEQTMAALMKLVNEAEVSVVIGPLLSKGIEAISTRAESLGIPLVSLSQQKGVVGNYTFYAGVTTQLQAEEITKYAVQKLGLKKFAILHPKDRFGEQYAQQFWDAVEANGGSITDIESYQPGETDFKKQIDRMVGLAYTEDRKKELEQLALDRETQKITRKTAKTAKYFDLPPQVDFDAVFIPDDPKVVGQIIPTFAYRDVDQVKFLGVSPWNSKEFLERAKGYGDKCYFVDALYLDSRYPPTQKFIARFMRDGMDTPTSIEASAYDAALAVDSVLKQIDANRVARSLIADRLHDVRQLAGATGNVSLQDGNFLRALNFLTIRENRIVEVSSVP